MRTIDDQNLQCCVVNFLTLPNTVCRRFDYPQTKVDTGDMVFGPNLPFETEAIVSPSTMSVHAQHERTVLRIAAGVHWLLHNGGRSNNRHPGYPWKYMKLVKGEKLEDHWPVSLREVDSAVVAGPRSQEAQPARLPFRYGILWRDCLFSVLQYTPSKLSNPLKIHDSPPALVCRSMPMLGFDYNIRSSGGFVLFDAQRLPRVTAMF